MSNAEVDLQKITMDLIVECERNALEWKARAEGARLLYRKLTESASSGGQTEDRVSTGQTEEAK